MKKATLAGSDRQRQQVWKGGLFTVINEKNEIILYVRFHSVSICQPTHCCVILSAFVRAKQD